jgi:hypothetical protein
MPLEQVLFLGTEIAAFVEFARTALARASFWTQLEATTQSLLLQLLAFVVGALAATAQGINVFPNADPTVGAIMTGVVAGLPAQAIHVVLALVGIRAGVAAPVENAPVEAQASGNSANRYMPYL